MSDPVEIRASSFGDFFDCPSRWEAIHIDGMTMPASVPAHMGTSVHFGSAIYDVGMMERRDVLVDEAVEAAIDAFEHPEEEVNWTRDDYSKRDALAVTIKATQAYCLELSPGNEYEAVELRPEPLDIDVDGQIIRISGRMDRTRIVRDTEHAGVGVTDVKTGRARVSGAGVVNTSGDKFQLGVYEILTEHSMAKPVTQAAHIAAVNTTKNVRTGVGKVYNAKGLMLGDDHNPGMIETAGKMVKAGLFPPNPRSRLCSEKFCPVYHLCTAHDD